MSETGPRFDFQSELPWNVAGITPAARDAARASARREGLSIGEWLTRRILRGLAEPEVAPEPWWALDSRGARAATIARSSTVDSVEMLARVTRSESESQSAGRRIEEQLKNLASRLEQTELRQSENVRTMTRTEAEFDIQSREHAQALDRLDARLAHLNDRILHIEQSPQTDGIRDAIKALHQGLSRLADQVADTTRNSTSRATQFAAALETLAERLAAYRDEEQEGSRALTDRILITEKALEKLDAAEFGRTDETSEIRRQCETIVQLSTTVDNLSRELAAGESTRAAVLARADTRLSKVEERIDDTTTLRRLESVQQALTDVTARFDLREQEEADASGTLHDELRSLSVRLDAVEQNSKEAIAELGAVVREAIGSLVHANPPPPRQSAPIPAFDLPATEDSAPLAMPQQPAETAPTTPETPAPSAHIDVPAAGHESISPRPDSFMTAARRTAAAASSAQTERAGQGAFFSWAGSPTAPEPWERNNLRLVLLAALGFVVVSAVGAALVLRNDASAPVTPAALTTAGKLLPAISSAKAAGTATMKPASLGQTVAALPAADAAAGGPSPRSRLATLAVAGNAKAQELLGLRYLDGDGEPLNEAEGAKWLERAASQGEAVAAYRLGTLYERGQGVPTDSARAVRWYMAAAKAGNCKAMHNLAVAYAEGIGVPKDPVVAAQWFAHAADLGLTDSQFNLGVLYERGMGVPQSLIDAYKWYAIAAAAGDTESRARIGALASQLGADDRMAAQKAAADFRAEPEAPAANALLDAATLVGG